MHLGVAKKKQDTIMLKSVVIANRGEIACRVIRTAKALGMRTIAVYSDADVNALHVRQADEAWCLGPAAAAESYLRADKILAIAQQAKADCIHPGYGFLSENASFVAACQALGLVFIGPDVPAIEQMGSKSAAKTIMTDAGIPLVPGYHGADQRADLLHQEGNKMGYPLLIKAVAGGGGKGMRVVETSADFINQLAGARREGLASFGNDDVLLEKYLATPRHVEVQVFCDRHGNGVYLGDRDCSAQRRHQKVIEEAPAPNLSEALRLQMGSTAVQAAQAIDYVGAGTVEFLLDPDGCYYFMEMNTRLQVEHPVTEMVTGIDLVAWQFKVAAGQPMPLLQHQIKLQGHAIEARIYAEDPVQGFQPSTGTINYLRQPLTSNNIRIDTGVLQGDAISSFYDPMIAKLIVWAEDRPQALAHLDIALQQYHLQGIATNVDFLRRLVGLKDFAQANLHTGIIEQHQSLLLAPSLHDQSQLLAMAALVFAQKPRQQFANLTAMRLNQPQQLQLDVGYLGHQYSVVVHQRDLNQVTHDQVMVQTPTGKITANYHLQGECLTLFTHLGKAELSLVTPQLDDYSTQHAAQTGTICAPMNGTLIACMVTEGQMVATGDPLVVVEAMKMEHTVTAPHAGIVEHLDFQVGDLVNANVQLLHLSTEDP
jgi:3-methylcrotonyl-CoA carboxylase alpha subunit